MAQQIKITQTSNADMNIGVTRTQTAVEWLVKELNLEGYDYTIQQAKQMEKEQIIDAYENGISDENERNLSGQFTNAEQYYNETYNK